MGKRMPFVFLMFLVTCLATHTTNCNHQSEKTSLQNLFSAILAQLQKSETTEEKLSNIEDNDAEEFRRETRKILMRCKIQNLCHCRSKMTGRNFCCDCAGGPCFPGQSEVISENGERIQMKDLTIGDQVLAALDNGQLTYSRVVAFLDRRPVGEAEYIELHTEDDENVIRISSNHIIYANSNKKRIFSTRYAKNVEQGDFVFAIKNATLLPVQVSKITRTVQTGAYVPLTEHGNIVVDNILASCYTSFDHSLAHFFMTPVRLFYQLLQDKQPIGIPAYVKWTKAVGNLLFQRTNLFTEVEIIQDPTCANW